MRCKGMAASNFKESVNPPPHPVATVTDIPVPDGGVREKKPTKRFYVSKLRSLSSQINQYKEQFQSIVSEEKRCLAQLEDLRSRRGQTATASKHKNIELQALNRDVQKKRDAVASIEHTLLYKNETKLEETIKRLEHQLQINNFKLKEEKKIVQEIDKLKRSRKHLKKFLEEKTELNAMRDRQQILRGERDGLTKLSIEISSEEERLRKELTRIGSDKAEVSKNIDDLMRQKETVSREMDRFLEEQHQLTLLKKEERNSSSQKQCADDGNLGFEDPYLKPRQLCANLILYLESFFHGNLETVSLTSFESPHSCATFGHSGPSSCSTPSYASLPIDIAHDPSIIILKRKDVAEDGAERRQNTKQRKRRNLHKKPITHTPETLEQFATLGLKAPCKMAEVPVSIEQLKAKKKFYEKLSSAKPEMRAASSDFLPLYSLSSATNSNMDCISDAFESLAINNNTCHGDSSVTSAEGDYVMSLNSAQLSIPAFSAVSEQINGFCGPLEDHSMFMSNGCECIRTETVIPPQKLILNGEGGECLSTLVSPDNAYNGIQDAAIVSVKLQCSLGEDKRTGLPTVGL